MRNVNGYLVALQAHRGVSTDAPENTFAAYRAAVEQGYDIIELDPKFVDCIVKRYIEWAGGRYDDVFLIRDGQKLRFDEVASFEPQEADHE